MCPFSAQGPAIQWQHTIGGSGYESNLSLQQTDDGGYILGGSSESNVSGDKTENSLGGLDFWVIKLAPETVPTEEAPTALDGLTLYPNPATDALFVQIDTKTILCLRNAFGQILLTQTIQNQLAPRLFTFTAWNLSTTNMNSLAE